MRCDHSRGEKGREAITSYLKPPAVTNNMGDNTLPLLPMGSALSLHTCVDKGQYLSIQQEL